MSEVVTGGIAVAAVSTCAALVGAAVGMGYLVYRGLSWLSESAKREMEQLEKELVAAPTHATTAEVRREFERQYALVKERASRVPSLNGHADTVARLLALKQSPLAAFVGKDQWKKLCHPRLSKRNCVGVLEEAGRQFARSNANLVASSIIDVATNMGFNQQRVNHKRDVRQTLVLEDSDGRAVVAEVMESDQGARINLDLTGFGDRSCHEVMDRFLKGLDAKDIRLMGMRRRSHYRREGVTPESLKFSRTRNERSRQVLSNEERREADMRRRQQLSESRRLRVTS